MISESRRNGHQATRHAPTRKHRQSRAAAIREWKARKARERAAEAELMADFRRALEFDPDVEREGWAT